MNVIYHIQKSHGSCRCHVFAKRQPVKAHRIERIVHNPCMSLSHLRLCTALRRSRFLVWLEIRISPTDLRPLLWPGQGCGPWEKRGEVAWHGPSAPGNTRSDQRSRLSPLLTRIYSQNRIARSLLDGNTSVQLELNYWLLTRNGECVRGMVYEEAP
jgi:hypothetical protein